MFVVSFMIEEYRQSNVYVELLLWLWQMQIILVISKLLQAFLVVLSIFSYFAELQLHI